MDIYSGPDGVDYHLDHFVPFSIQAKVTLGDDEFVFPLVVKFRWHCWSRGRNPNENDDWLLPRHPGDPERRMFCPERWDYSQQLKRQLLGDAVWRFNCFGTKKAGHYFRLDRTGLAARRPSVEGWYMFFQLDAVLAIDIGLELSVESLHYRTTAPTNARGNLGLALWKAMAEYIQARPDFQIELRKAKGP